MLTDTSNWSQDLLVSISLISLAMYPLKYKYSGSSTDKFFILQGAHHCSMDKGNTECKISLLYMIRNMKKKPNWPPN